MNEKEHRSQAETDHVVQETERCPNESDMTAAAQHQRISIAMQTAGKEHQTVEVARVIPQEPVKPAGEKI